MRGLDKIINEAWDEAVTEVQKEMPEYRELLQEMKKAKPGKEARALHKKMKKYDTGLLFRDRYPNFDIWVSVVALAVAVIAFILQCFGVGN